MLYPITAAMLAKQISRNCDKTSPRILVTTSKIQPLRNKMRRPPPRTPKKDSFPGGEEAFISPVREARPPPTRPERTRTIADCKGKYRRAQEAREDSGAVSGATAEELTFLAEANPSLVMSRGERRVASLGFEVVGSEGEDGGDSDDGPGFFGGAVGLIRKHSEKIQVTICHCLNVKK